MSLPPKPSPGGTQPKPNVWKTLDTAGPERTPIQRDGVCLSRPGRERSGLITTIARDVMGLPVPSWLRSEARNQILGKHISYTPMCCRGVQ